MFCTNCGASNENDATFCINCGGSLSEIQREEKLSCVRVLNNKFSLEKIDFLKALFDFSFNQ
ncbi:MAG: zinc ribbon domain-containing protein, partial [Thermodesulfobacteriota bacterium]